MKKDTYHVIGIVTDSKDSASPKSRD